MDAHEAAPPDDALPAHDAPSKDASANDAAEDAADASDAEADTDGPADAEADVDEDAAVDAGGDSEADANADAADADAADATTDTDAASDAAPDATSDGGTDAASGDAADGGGTVTFVPGVTVSTLAGSSMAGEVDGTGSGAEFTNPTGIALDAQGNLVVTDYDGSTVRRVTPAGVVTTLAATSGFVGPFAAVVASDGTYYVETDFNTSGVKNATSGTIWKVVPLADAGVATPTPVAQGFGRPRGLAPLTAGNLFLSDRLMEIVEQLDPASGTTAFIAGALGDAGFQDGTGSAAQFSNPLGAAVMPDGSIVVADAMNNRIRQVTLEGVVTTFAGDGTAAMNDGPALSAQFNFPGDVAVDAAGNVYVTDEGNQRIRRIRTDGTVETLAGNGTQGFQDGAGNIAEFYGQEGIAVTPDGATVYVTDGNRGTGTAYHRVRAISVP